ncbi:hypothetical protein BC351_28920 [Paenibacillus ferrarius]|uniref:HTH cro/C1-type domain-containing protein n=1 Tax=Paenibacillus ferrarius TaxID=1469647 RepID=A0A1V4HIC6_9BACL|nr:helix-turn-helix transcriptional regulator [Paenibacillus ferrarius]OPH56193.1 hypothetical protein BC351_28920 [Paenibacillus ferrarius]
MNYSLGQYLRSLRGKMSLREAGKRSNLSFTYIRDLELGINRSNNSPLHPSPETLKKLSEAYECSFDDIMNQAGLTISNEDPQLNTSTKSVDNDENPDLIKILKMEPKVSVGTYFLSPTDKIKLMEIMETLFLKYKNL